MSSEQGYAFWAGREDGRRDHLDGWANHSPSYQAGQVMARVERDLAATPTDQVKDAKGGDA